MLTMFCGLSMGSPQDSTCAGGQREHADLFSSPLVSLSVLQGLPGRSLGRKDSHAAENALIGCWGAETWAFLSDRLKVANRIYVPVNGAIDDAQITNDLGLIRWAAVR